MITHFIESLSKMNKKLALLLAFAFCGFSLILLTDPYKEILDSVDPTEEISSLPDEDDKIMHSNETINQSKDYLLWTRRPESINWTAMNQMCKGVLAGNKKAIQQARKWKIPNPHTDKTVYHLLSDCNRFRKLVPFVSTPSSEEERQFPLAYALIAARNAAQTVRLIRMIYQPQNVYCIAFDKKSSAAYQRSMQQMSKCFDNVFLAPDPEVIDWGKYAILRSSMSCVKVLFQKWSQFRWRYVQVLSWNDFPLKSNAEMVKIFKILNGSQDSSIEGNTVGYFVDHGVISKSKQEIARPVVPDGLTIYKGSFANSMTVEFVQFLLTNPTSLRFYKWLENTHCAEEHYWTTLIHNIHLGAPGSFPGQCFHFYDHKQKKKPYLSRYQVWSGSRQTCDGEFTNWSCVYGVGDVESLTKLKELVAHKVYEEVQPAASFCLEQWFWSKNERPFRDFDEGYYQKLPSVRYQRESDKNSFVC